MDFTFSDEQQQLRVALRELAADQCPPSRLREVIGSGDCYDDKLWKLLAVDMGVAGITVSEQRGGTGGSFVDAAVVLEEAGRALLPVPALTALVAAAVLDTAEPSATELLPGVAEGEQLAVTVVAPDVTRSASRVTGSAAHVLDAARAGLFVVAGGDGLYVVAADAPGVTVTAGAGLDLTRRHAVVSLDVPEAAVTVAGDADAAERAVDRMRVALAVESVGVARHCLGSTVDYVKTRRQFGRPIGSFQAVQHRLADLAVELEAAASTAYFAAWAAAASSDAELPVVAPLAKAVCTEAAYRIAAETIQLHGGIGFTWEHDAHLYFKRAASNRVLLGDPTAERRLVARRAHLGGGR